MQSEDIILKNEKALIQGCIENNRVFQNQLYKIFAGKMMGICLRYAKTREDAEDILQEGFIQVFTRIHQFRFSGSFNGWVKKIFINCALQKLREKENNYTFIDVYRLPENLTPSYGHTESIDNKVLIQYIQSLPLTARLVFNLYVFEGFKHKEIAKMLNITEGTSKSNLFDARKNLQGKLKEFDYIKAVANE